MDELEEKLKLLLKKDGKRSKASVIRAHLSLIESLLNDGYTHQSIVDALREAASVEMSVGVFRETLRRVKNEKQKEQATTSISSTPVVLPVEQKQPVETQKPRRQRNIDLSHEDKISDPVSLMQKGRPDNPETKDYFDNL